MNKQTLASLPEDVQTLIKPRFSGAEVGARASACWNELGAKVVEELKAEGQVFEPLSSSDQARSREIAASVTQDYIGKLEAEGKPAEAFYDALVAELDAARN